MNRDKSRQEQNPHQKALEDLPDLKLSTPVAEKYHNLEQLPLDAQFAMGCLTWETAIHLILRWYDFREEHFIAHGAVARIPATNGTLCSSIRLFALPAQTSIGELNIVILVLSSNGEWMLKRALYRCTTISVDWFTQPVIIEIRRWRLVDDMLVIVE